jgi:hypothetical protein
MAGPLNATVVLARCSKTKNCFGIRVEQRGKEWVRTWAFPIDERKAKREGFDANKVNLSGQDDAYPGCPYCKDRGFAKCSCDKIGCLGGLQKKGELMEYPCPWCGQTGKMEFAESINVSGGGY